ncbi:response regulator transcription factor [Polaromonas sp. YR568]|uniref:response regulator transcription factor n=1 Tax=Polaromonas sp. YR568 TaxID=1855301 RepID=UPI00398BD8F3
MPGHAQLPQLTDRQRTIFFELLKGRSSKEVARALHISPATVAKHREHIYARLDVNRVSELARYAGGDGERVLTCREQEIVHLLQLGWTSARIARHLGLSTYTVQTHRQHIRGKRPP